MLEECNVEYTRKGILSTLINKSITKYRQTAQYNSAKRSIMLIPSQISRNLFIMNRVAEYIELTLNHKSDTKVFFMN